VWGGKGGHSQLLAAASNLHDAQTCQQVCSELSIEVAYGVLHQSATGRILVTVGTLGNPDSVSVIFLQVSSWVDFR
jgi:hypothetical protein